MERWPMVAIAAAALLGAAAVQPLIPEQRTVVAIGLAVFLIGAARSSDGSARFRAILLLALVAGASDAWAHLATERTIEPSRTTRLRCTVAGDVQSQNGVSSFLCTLDSGPTLLVSLSGPAPVVASHLLLRGRVAPFDESRNPLESSERSLERDRGAAGRIEHARQLAILPPANPTVAIEISRFHAWATAMLRARLDEPGASILAGELWGDRGSLPPDLRTEFQETGTVHVLVTAGLHLGVVAALVLALLGALRAPRIAACFIAIVCVWLYALVSGMHVPAIRAATMLSFALAARAYGAKTLSFNAIAAAALLVGLGDPLAIPGASFALSFACVIAIAAWAEPIDELLQPIASLPERIREAVTLTIATQLGTWPLTAAIFNTFSPYAVAANLAVVPAVGATMLLGFAQLVFTPLAPLAQAVANINDWLFAWMAASVHAVASLPVSSIPMTPAPSWAIACYEAAVVGGACLWRMHRRPSALLALALAAIVVIAPPRMSDHRLRVTVLDVGQADSIVIQTPGGHTLLVDAGGRLERGAPSAGDSAAERIGERIVAPFLLRNGVHHLDALIISHPHGDHVGGCTPVLRKLRVATIADSGQMYGGHAYHDCLDTARGDGVSLIYPRAGMVWHTVDGVTLRFIGPSIPFIGGKNAINDNSIAFILEYRHFRMLFTGDAGVAAERRFLNEGVDLHAEVLKVGHHGSAYSSSPAFIAAVNPRYAIVSVGRHNLFGHPAPSTIETLENAGARIYRTDEDAAATVTTDGTTVHVETMRDTWLQDYSSPRQRK